MGYTTGRELHPALKIVIQLRTIIISDIISVNKKFFSRLSKYNNLQAGKHRLFLNILLFGKLLSPVRVRAALPSGKGIKKQARRCRQIQLQSGETARFLCSPSVPLSVSVFFQSCCDAVLPAPFPSRLFAGFWPARPSGSIFPPTFYAEGRIILQFYGRAVYFAGYVTPLQMPCHSACKGQRESPRTR